MVLDVEIMKIDRVNIFDSVLMNCGMNAGVD